MLVRHRSLIDAIDLELLGILCRRLAICADIARYKQRHGMRMFQPQRATFVMDRAIAAGRGMQLDESFVRGLFELVLAEACRVGEAIISCERATSGQLAASHSGSDATAQENHNGLAGGSAHRSDPG